jgi:transcriptional regulator GlxA family with amidase domain
MTLRDVSVIVLPGVSPFELGVACEGFGLDRSDQGLPNYDFALVSLEEGPVRTQAGFDILTPHRLERTRSSDLVIIPACGTGIDYDERILQALRDAVNRGARVMSICSGAFVLGAAGLLEGRSCTTHWRYANQLAAAFPEARVEPDVLYVEDRGVLTSAGTAAGLDLVLHIMRTEHGADVANTVARRMVMPPHRDGGQAQYVQAPVAAVDADTLSPLLEWVLENLDQDHTVDSLARRANMSSRTFARRFAAQTGSAPYAWLVRQRVFAAQRLLELGDDPVEVVAHRCGFANAAALRQHFIRIVGTTPQAYRRTFAGPALVVG